MIKKLGILALFSLTTSLSFANVDTVRENIKKQYPNLKISNIQKTEMPGLYSANLDQQIIYLGEDGQHMFVGSMIRLKDQKNLTKDLVLGQNSIDWKQLPLKDAIKTAKGNGQHVLAVFSDPNCPYCKQLEPELDKLKDVTIYTFIYPLKPQSIVVSRQVWCAPNQSYSWKKLIEQGVKPMVASCTNPIDRNLELGKKLGFNGTPTLIFANGFKLVGARSAEEIQAVWKELGL
ncbi:thioredoxin family protein [Acinetobacter baumannii 25493_8]|uniref:DsbC family protein n=1 Tax=Acinetobacter baumannii TaxID=470 RepID=UPI0002B9396D|nr:DsbC family protein [Acinetobacter baumannii]EYD49034.1 thioredoxin family protein [Acinetobacter baumannii 25493_4]EYS10443.1 thioredoxin family protein [Acinetobacter baumannii 25569_7]EHU2137036.1 DsbC family protein [Acinetobacter baumannii]EIG0125235.1 DsbC family protein [Acinetobacter baumannii]EIY0855148.1 DsbC family protein [Acinetobacter baumannii]